MKCSNIHKLSACELTMLAATTATSLTQGLDHEEMAQLQNFLHLLSENISAIRCQHLYKLSCRDKKDGCKPSHH